MSVDGGVGEVRSVWSKHVCSPCTYSPPKTHTHTCACTLTHTHMHAQTRLQNMRFRRGPDLMHGGLSENLEKFNALLLRHGLETQAEYFKWVRVWA